MSFLVKMVKIWPFGGQKCRHRSKIGEIGEKNFSLKFCKSISVKFMGMNLVKNVINGANLVKTGILWCFVAFFLYFLVKIAIH